MNRRQWLKRSTVGAGALGLPWLCASRTGSAQQPVADGKKLPEPEFEEPPRGAGLESLEEVARLLRKLPSRERLILRMNLVEHVSTTQIAALYRVSQPTVSRWIQRSAKSIFAAVKNLVCDELAIDTRELESLLLLVRSQIDITLSHATGNSSFPSS